MSVVPGSSGSLTNVFRAAVNNTGLDPLVGFDAEVWVTDVATGLIVSVGMFQSCTISIRNATETYLELGQRIPIYLDGEIQIAWVLEQGLVDMGFLERYFGVNTIARDQYITRGPRFTISVDMNAAALTQAASTTTGSNATNTSSDSYFTGSRNYFAPGTSNQYAYSSPNNRLAYGRYEMQRCKLDSLSLGIMPGRRVIAQRWEGVSEGIRYVQNTVQGFKNTPGGIPSTTPAATNVFNPNQLTPPPTQ